MGMYLSKRCGLNSCGLNHSKDFYHLGLKLHHRLSHFDPKFGHSLCHFGLKSGTVLRAPIDNSIFFIKAEGITLTEINKKCIIYELF